MRVSIQGELGSYHHRVATELFPSTTEIIFNSTFSEVYASVLDGSSDVAISAIANNRYGFISESFRELLDSYDDIWVKAEYLLQIRHQLLGVKGTSVSDIKELVSQSVATIQCRKFIEKNLTDVNILDYTDTAASAKLVAENGSKELAAIASTEAAKLYGLDIVQPDIQDDKENITRFLVFEKKPVQSHRYIYDKYTAILTTNQRAGSLAEVLNIFSRANINISSLHSSFVPNTRFHMVFFIEFEINDSFSATSLVSQIKRVDADLDIIGNYQSMTDIKR